jgi:DNA-binding CsgD family transcriptional regulator
VKLKKYFPAAILVSATLFFAYDIIGDLLDDSENIFHILIELVVFLAMSAVLFRELHQVRLLNNEVWEQQIKTARLSGELLAVMRDQFRQWGLSPSESEVALLLIKGLSMREISEARQVKEKTIRQQATSIYSKSGYAGRHELVAHFIEDLMNDVLNEP